LDKYALSKDFAISPDGRNLVYIAYSNGNTRLILRPMDKFETITLNGTEGAYFPFFSPDGVWVGFFADGELKKVMLETNNTLPIVDYGSFSRLSPPAGAAWLVGNEIIFVNQASGLSRVSATSGEPEELTKIDDYELAIKHSWPERLPGKKAILFTIFQRGETDNGHIAILDLETRVVKKLDLIGANARYVSSGHIVYGQAGTLMVARFNIDKLELENDPVPIRNDVIMLQNGDARYSFSNNGSMVYVTGEESGLLKGELVWIDRKGVTAPERLTEERMSYVHPRLSHDRKKLLVTVREEGSESLWIYDDLEQENKRPLNLSGGSSEAIWSQDDKSIVFTHYTPNIYQKQSIGIVEVELLLETEFPTTASSWSSDGNILAFYMGNPVTQRDIWMYNFQESTMDKFSATRFNERSPMFSPVSQWIAYTSDELGRDQIFVKPYPVNDSYIQISFEGGYEPLWSPDGTELFYRNGDKMMAVSIEYDPIFKPGTPVMLFEEEFFTTTNISDYDYDLEKERFLMIKLEEKSTISQINVTTNWFEELKRLAPVKKE